MVKIVHGKVHGKTIEIDQDLGLAEGQDVELELRTTTPPEETATSSPPKKWGKGFWQCAGAMADEWTDEDDRIFEEIYRDRKNDTRPEIPD